MADFLDEKRKEIQARLDELRPLVDEYQRLEAAESALAGVTGGTRASARAASTAAAPRARRRTRAASGNGRRTRRRSSGGGTRSQQALDLVRSKPGISIPELAAAMGIKQNYLYRVMPALAEQGLVTKSGRGWEPKGS
jgi:sugar-specific transcriptional regulator TrmB